MRLRSPAARERLRDAIAGGATPPPPPEPIVGTEVDSEHETFVVSMIGGRCVEVQADSWVDDGEAIRFYVAGRPVLGDALAARPTEVAWFNRSAAEYVTTKANHHPQARMQ